MDALIKLTVRSKQQVVHRLTNRHGNTHISNYGVTRARKQLYRHAGNYTSCELSDIA
jgi:hypothetical protein